VFPAEYTHDLDPIVAALVRDMARRLTGRARLNDEDIEDLAQDCRAELIRKLRAFDPTKSAFEAFVVGVLRHFLANRIRDRFAAKRNPCRVRALDALTGVVDSLSPGIDRPSRIRSEREGTDLRLDVDALLDRLPPRLRALAERLKIQSVAEIARETGVPRTTVQSRIRSIRMRFASTRLTDFL
jgi:RNA polymerase sigma-70 factor, ECF subfamily